MQTVHVWLFISWSILLFASCTKDARKDIEAYYYPIDDLEVGKVYEYRPVGQDTIGSDYWYYFTLKQDGKTFFIGNAYDANLNVTQFVREERVQNGMLLNDMYLYATDSLGKSIKISTQIEADNVFPFKVSAPSGVFLYKVRWDDPFERGSHTTLVRNRRYLGDTTYVYQGKTYDCIKLGVRELIENYVANEGYAEPAYSGFELYAKGLGLVYYQKNISAQFQLAYALVDTFGMQTLEQRLEID